MVGPAETVSNKTGKKSSKPGEHWYSLYKKAQEQALTLRQSTQSPVELAHLVLIELADWRWLRRSNLKLNTTPDWDFRRDCINLWAETLDSEQCSHKERLILAEAIYWSIASLANYRQSSPDESRKKLLNNIVEFVIETISENKNLDSLLLAVRVFCHQGKSGAVKRLGVDLPLNLICEHLKEIITANIDRNGKNYVYDSYHDAKTPQATVVAIELLSLVLFLEEKEDSAFSQDLRDIGRQSLAKPFNRVLASEWPKKAERYVSYWMSKLDTNWWLVTVALRWHLADWVIFDPSWEEMIKNATTKINPELLASISSPPHLRAIAEGCLTLADDEPAVILRNLRQLQLAILEVIRDEQVAKTVGDRLVRYLQSQSDN